MLFISFSIKKNLKLFRISKNRIQSNIFNEHNNENNTEIPIPKKECSNLKVDNNNEEDDKIEEDSKIKNDELSEMNIINEMMENQPNKKFAISK